MKYLVHQKHRSSYEFETDCKISFYVGVGYLNIEMFKPSYGIEYYFEINDDEDHNDFHILTWDKRVSVFLSDTVGARLMQELKNVGIEVNEI